MELGQLWIDFGDTLRQASQDAAAAARTVASINSGDAIDAFQAKWSAEKSAVNVLDKAAMGGPLVGAALYVCAAVVLDWASTKTTPTISSPNSSRA